MAFVAAMRTVMRCSTVIIDPAQRYFQTSAMDCRTKPRAARKLTSAWARPDCTTALSRIGVLPPRMILFFARSTNSSSAARAMAAGDTGEADLVAGAVAHAVE